MEEGQTIQVHPFSGRFKKTLSRLAIFSILFLMVPPPIQGTNSPGSSQPSTALQTPATPQLIAGDTWHYQYTGPEGYSTERVVGSEPCGSTQCAVDNEANSYSNDSAWITPDWSFGKEYCIGCDGSKVITQTTYTPPLQLYSFPLKAGKSWWWNSTGSGSTTDTYGNHPFSYSFSVLRKVVNETSITVPAGTFDTFLVAQYR